jgi:phosphate-selective porin OprO/OprP
LGGFQNKAWSEDLPPPTSAGAQASGGPPPATEQSSGDLDQRVRILERKLEIADENATTKAKETPFVKVGSEGFQFGSTDKAFLIKIRGLIQADSRQFIDDRAGNETNQFLLRRVRPILEGTLCRDFSFLITPDFASNGKAVLYDAYLDIAPWTFAKLRVGKFKPPIGLEHLQSDPYLTFAERGFPSLLVPSRDTGLQLFGDAGSGIVSYAVALTNGVGDNNTNAATAAPVTSDTDNNDSKETTARLVLKPFKTTPTPLAGLGLGFSASYAKNNTLTPNYTTPGQISIFALNAPAIAANTPQSDGAKTRIAPDINWYYHSFGLYGEYVRSSQVYRVGTVKSTITHQAGQVGSSYVLTGEDASYTGVKPRKPFDPHHGTWGAFEVASRYNVLLIDPDAYTRGIVTASGAVQQATAWAVGVNWYLNNAVRFTTDYEQTSFDKGAPLGDRSTEKVLTSRWQLYF